MWLCQFEECRRLTHSSYIDREVRAKRFEELQALGHDLIEIVNQVRKIPEYANDTGALRFLGLIERIVRCYYFPPYRADKTRNWADARYPKRIYNDITQESQAESFKTYPPAKWISKLFRQMQLDADRIWSLRAALSEQSKQKTISNN
jgi:hypothetical protein